LVDVGLHTWSQGHSGAGSGIAGMESEIWYGGAILISEIVRGLENSVSVGLTGIKYSVIVMYIYCLELLTLKNSLNDVWHGCPRECQAAVLDAE